MRELFDDADPGDEKTLADAVADDWQAHQHRPGAVHAGRGHDRRLHRLTLPRQGWFVDIGHSASLAAIRTALGPLLAAFGLTELTAAALRAEDRRVTIAIADWVQQQARDDDTRACGVCYRSKFGSDWHCWAVWLDGAAGAESVRGEAITSDRGVMIDDPGRNPALRSVADLFGPTMW